MTLTLFYWISPYFGPWYWRVCRNPEKARMIHGQFVFGCVKLWYLCVFLWYICKAGFFWCKLLFMLLNILTHKPFISWTSSAQKEVKRTSMAMICFISLFIFSLCQYKMLCQVPEAIFLWGQSGLTAPLTSSWNASWKYMYIFLGFS